MKRRSNSFQDNEEIKKYRILNNGIKVLLKKEEDFRGFNTDLIKAPSDIKIFQDISLNDNKNWNLYPFRKRFKAVNFTANTGSLNLALQRFFDFKLNVEYNPSSIFLLKQHMENRVLDDGKIISHKNRIISYHKYNLGFVTFTNQQDLIKNHSGYYYTDSVYSMIKTYIRLQMNLIVFFIPKNAYFSKHMLHTFGNKQYCVIQINIRPDKVFDLPNNRKFTLIFLVKTNKKLKIKKLRKQTIEINTPYPKTETLKNLQHKFMINNGFVIKHNEPLGIKRVLEREYNRNDKERVILLSKEYDPLVVYYCIKYILFDGSHRAFGYNTIEHVLKKYNQHNLVSNIINLNVKTPFCHHPKPQYRIKELDEEHKIENIKIVNNFPKFNFNTKYYEKEEVQENIVNFYTLERKTKKNDQPIKFINPDYLEFIRHYPRHWTYYNG